jgi:ubiquinol-cytochrome c reductase cytochrome c1 subunit
MRAVFAILALAPALAFGAGPALKLDAAPIDPTDVASLQAGARTFVNHCLNCHSAALVRYNQLTMIGLTEQQIRDNLLFTAEKVGELMKVSASAADQRVWFGAAPPDLSVTARSRGVDWLYNYMKGFYRDPSTPTGWNNTVYPNVGMPHVLWNLQGVREGAYEEVDDGHGGKTKRLKLGPAQGGSQSTLEYQKTVVDLVNFMAWMGEPHAMERKRIGFYVLIALGVLMLVTYLLKAAYWKDVH